MAKRPTLIGRAKEAAALQHAIADPHKKLVWVAGPAGAGKTTLASEIVAVHRDEDLAIPFVRASLGHDRSADEILAQLMIDLGGVPKGALSNSSFFERVVEYAAERERGLYFIDNVEPKAFLSDQFQSFAESWLDGDHEVCLLLTLRSLPASPKRAVRQSPAAFELDLTGLHSERAVLDLLGDAMVRRYKRRELLDTAAQLGNLPQRLLQMRWSGEAPSDYLRSLDATGQKENSSPLRSVLDDQGLVPFCSCLGLLRTIEFDRSLLDEIWARGLGNPAIDLSMAITYLHEQMVLLPGAVQDTAYRIHPTVHGDLARFAETQSRSWRARVHQALTDHFRGRMHASPPPDVELAQHFTHHALLVGREAEVWDLVCADGGLEQWRRQGRAVDAHLLLSDLSEYLDRHANTHPPEDRAELLLGRANVASDLGRPTESMRLLNEALDEVAEETEGKAIWLRRAIWMQLAISHANLGQVDDCIAFYLGVIREDPQVTDVLTALCMGYVAYEYCGDMLDLDKAAKWAKLALRSCPRERDPSVFAKNLCNWGLQLYFSGDVERAAATFEEAVAIVSDQRSGGYDIREYGRVLAHLGMATLSTVDGDVDEALAQLRDALALNRRAGDLRRILVSLGRMGIAEWRSGDRNAGWRHLSQAALGHSAMGDLRNMAVEALALEHMARSAQGDDLHVQVFPDADHLPMSDELRGVLRSVQRGGPQARYRTVWDGAYHRMLGGAS
jgi:tetratricopeptide (TPR) repeat protein